MTLTVDLKPVIEWTPAMDTVVQGIPGFMWTGIPRKCMRCADDTCWLDLTFEGPLCPGVCSEAMWDEYAWAEALAILRERVSEITGAPMRDLRCPNKDCRPPSYCGLCKGTGKIPD